MRLKLYSVSWTATHTVDLLTCIKFEEITFFHCLFTHLIPTKKQLSDGLIKTWPNIWKHKSIHPVLYRQFRPQEVSWYIVLTHFGFGYLSIKSTSHQHHSLAEYFYQPGLCTHHLMVSFSKIRHLVTKLWSPPTGFLNMSMKHSVGLQLPDLNPIPFGMW